MQKIWKKRGLILLCIPAALYMIFSVPLWFMTSQESIAQTPANQTNQNQTVFQTPANQTNQNLTVLQRGNVTEESFEPIVDDLNAARSALQEAATQAMQGNFNQTAFNRLSEINNELFKIIRLAGPESTTVMEELQTLQSYIDSAQDAIRDSDDSKALQELNSADIEVFRLNQQVTSEE